MSRRNPRVIVGLAGTRRGRRGARRRRIVRLWRRHLLLGVLAFLTVLVPEALTTSRRSDEVAVLVVSIWAAAWLGPGSRPGPPPWARRLLIAAGCFAGGLALYWVGLAMPPADWASETGGPGPMRRPCVVVTSEENPVVLARVVGLNPDLSLVIDGGGGGEEGAQGGEVVCLAGLEGQAGGWASAAAIRLVTEEVLGRVVMIRVVGVEADRLSAFVFSEITRSPSVAEGDSLNQAVAALLNAANPGGAGGVEETPSGGGQSQTPAEPN